MVEAKYPRIETRNGRSETAPTVEQVRCAAPHTNQGSLRGMKMSHKFMIIVLAVFTASTLIAQLSSSDQAAIDAYRAAIRSAENGVRELEAAFSKLISLTQTLTRSRGAQGAVLEAISAEEFEHLRRDLPGVLINREEVVFV